MKLTWVNISGLLDAAKEFEIKFAPVGTANYKTEIVPGKTEVILNGLDQYTNYTFEALAKAHWDKKGNFSEEVICLTQPES